MVNCRELAWQSKKRCRKRTRAPAPTGTMNARPCALDCGHCPTASHRRSQTGRGPPVAINSTHIPMTGDTDRRRQALGMLRHVRIRLAACGYRLQKRNSARGSRAAPQFRAAETSRAIRHDAEQTRRLKLRCHERQNATRITSAATPGGGGQADGFARHAIAIPSRRRNASLISQP